MRSPNEEALELKLKDTERALALAKGRAEFAEREVGNLKRRIEGALVTGQKAQDRVKALESEIAALRHQGAEQRAAWARDRAVLEGRAQEARDAAAGAERRVGELLSGAPAGTVVGAVKQAVKRVRGRKAVA